MIKCFGQNNVTTPRSSAVFCRPLPTLLTLSPSQVMTVTHRAHQGYSPFLSSPSALTLPLP